MCGRFVSASPADFLGSYFSADPLVELDERYNVAPTEPIYTITAAENQRRLTAMRWGLLPHFAKTQRGRPLFNARSETIGTNNSFRRSFAERRCIIPLDGFYEWAPQPEADTKQAYYIHHRDEEPLAVAGIWRTWKPEEQNDDAALTTAAMITCAANKTMSNVHDRMPVILPPAAWDNWLNPTTPTSELATSLVPAIDSLLRLRPVSNQVNNSRNDGPDLTAQES